LSDHFLYRSHVWHRDCPVRFDEEVRLVRVHTLEEAEIGKDYSRSSTHPGCTVNVDFETLFVDHLVKNLSPSKKLLLKVSLIEVMDRVVAWGDTVFGVKL